MQWLLVAFGWIFTIVCLLCILVPYLRRRADLLSTWNLFLLGSANFVGIASIQSGMASTGLYGTYTDRDYVKFVIGAIVFYVTAGLTYRFAKWPRVWAARVMRKWTRQSIAHLMWLTVFSLVLVIGFLAVPNIQLLGQLMISIGLNANVFAFVFAFGAWYRRPFNPALFAIMLAMFGMALIISIHTGFGRRGLLSVLLAAPICLYWLRLRYQPARKMLLPFGAICAVTVVLIGGFSVIRAGRIDPDLSMVQAAIVRLKAIPSAFMERGDATSLMGGDTTEASLLAIGHYARARESHPFHTVIYVVTNPIPRRWYPDKVGSLGEDLPRDTGWWSRHGYVSWGVGIVGHGYYEGGLHFLVFYGVLFALALRFWDELLQRQPNNLVLLGIYAAASAQVFALVRGEVPLFIVMILGSWLTGFLLNWSGRLLFGTDDYSHPHEQPYDVAPEEGPFEEFVPEVDRGGGGFANY